MSEGEETLFSWVHLSDLHALRGEPWNRHGQDFVLRALEEDIHDAVEKKWCPAPRALLFTGDAGDAATNGGAVEGEYEQAAQHLRNLAAAAGCPHEIFAVPGDHDVRRTATRLEEAVVERVRGGSLDVDAALNEEGTRALLEDRIARYRTFARALRRGLDTLGSWSESSEESNLIVRVVGLNTALLANDDQDRGNLRVGKRQLAPLDNHPREGELVVVLSHHPAAGGWLADQEDAGTRIRTRAHVHLSGYVHGQGALCTALAGESKHVAIAAGAEGGKLGRYVYYFAAVVKQQSTALLRVYPRCWAESRQGFVADTTLASAGSTYSDYPLAVKLAVPKQEESKAPRSENPPQEREAVTVPRWLVPLVVALGVLVLAVVAVVSVVRRPDARSSLLRLATSKESIPGFEGCGELLHGSHYVGPRGSDPAHRCELQPAGASFQERERLYEAAVSRVRTTCEGLLHGEWAAPVRPSGTRETYWNVVDSPGAKVAVTLWVDEPGGEDDKGQATVEVRVIGPQ